MKTKRLDPNKALEHIHHAVYLQWFIGFSMAVIMPFAAANGINVIQADGDIAGGMLLFLGLNTWLYVRRYERSLGLSSSLDAQPRA